MQPVQTSATPAIPTMQQFEADTRQPRAGEMQRLCRALMERLRTTEERERHQLAGILHDDALQLGCQVERLLHDALVSTSLSAHTREAIEEALSLNNALVGQLRGLVGDLYPPSPTLVGLPQALSILLQGIERRTALHCFLQCDARTNHVCATPGHEQQELLYSIAREAVLNVVKHARATTLRVTLHCDSVWLAMRVRDDGIGCGALTNGDMRSFLRQGHLGLSLIQGRARLLHGTAHISSGPGAGTTLTVRVPLPERANDNNTEHEYKEENWNI